ncbi:hypothetical protein, partial [Streptomyces vinaceus]|uniref:hypothetical protein n=1 Tax=Streptomyces vinaceus TaxID=1960 RepID=UPI0036CC961C
MADVSDYEKALPRVQEHVARYEKALAEIRTTHAGRPAPEVREALLAAGERYGVRCGVGVVGWCGLVSLVVEGLVRALFSCAGV